MSRPSLLAATALFLFVFAGCDNASSEDKKVRNAKAEANDKSGAAIGEAAEKVKSAQAEADEKVAAARADFAKLREDYRHMTTTNLVDLDHHVADLAAKAKQSTGTTKDALDASLKQIHTTRDAFDRDCLTLDRASASTWDDARSRVDREWLELKALVDKA